MEKTELELLILRNLLTDEKYMRKVAPFLKRDYFEGAFQYLFNEIVEFVGSYNKLPTEDSLQIQIEKSDDISDTNYGEIMSMLPKLYEKKEENEKWLLDTTEQWCQDRAIYLAIMESISVIDGKHKKLTKNALPDILQKALAVSFDTNVGHDYIDNADERYDFYHTELERVPFDLEIFNRITKGGVPKKTLNVILAGTNVGKSLFMCHMAAGALSMGKNVLYVTMEMAEERIAERIDANLLDVPIDSVEKMTKKAFREGVQSIASKSNGRLIIKEYPTAGAHVNHFRALLEELSLKRKFKPDIVFIDYLNICCSSRTKMGGAVNSYTYIKNIAEELRGLAVEQELPIFTATQLNRTGFTNSDPGLEDTSESFGLPATADFMFSMTTNDELESMNQIMIKQLKSRYGNKNDTKRFLVGVDYSKMRIYDIDESQQDLLTEDIPVFDNTDAGRGISKEKLDSLKVF